MVIVTNTMGDKVPIFWMGKMLENMTIMKDGDFKVSVKIGVTSFGLKEFKDFGSNFEW